MTASRIEALKAEGRYAAAGSLAFSVGQPRAYGCHFGLRSELQSARAAFEAGYDAAAAAYAAVDAPVAATKVATPRAYRGKYPSRICTVSTITGRPGVYFAETNDGRKFEIRHRDMLRAGFDNTRGPICGVDITDYPAAPFRVGFSRAMAALYRVARGSEVNFEPDGVTARDIAAAALVDARRPSPILTRLNAAQAYTYALSFGPAMRLESPEWARLFSEAETILRAAAQRLASRALRRKHAGSDIAKRYRAIRAARQESYRDRTGTGLAAADALAFARGGARVRKPATIGHGDLLRHRGPNGVRRNFVVVIAPDDDATPPWDRADGHGSVSEWRSARYGGNVSKQPGERPLCSDRGSARFYDWAGAIETAKRDGWGLAPDELAEFARKLGRTPTRKQIAAEAVRRDFEFLRAWCNDQWSYVGVCLVEMDRKSGQHDDAEEFAHGVLAHNFYRVDIAASLWGIESDSTDYLGEVALELLSEAVAK